MKNLTFIKLDSNLFKLLELLFLAIFIPTIVIFFNLETYIVLFVWIIFLYTFFLYFYLYGNKKLNINFLNYKSLDKNYIIIIFIRWIVATIFIYLITYCFFNEKLFFIQKNNPNLLWKILLFYPFFSALPQEFIFCTFFFKRYKSLIKSERKTIFLSTLLFCFSHVLFINIVAPILGLIGGYLFAKTYSKTKSLALVSLEHALYGNSLFFIGLGWYFWGGSVH